MLNGRRGLHGLYLKGSTNIGKRRRAERQALRVVCLPALVFGSQIKRTGVLQIRRQDDGLITGLAGQLNAEIPAVKCDKRKLKVLGQ